MEWSLYEICVAIVIAYSIMGWFILTGIKINYGRLQGSLTKILINPKIGWFVFEVPNLIWAAYFLLFLQNEISLAYMLFIIHYINRDIIYPLSLKSNTKIPLEIMLSAFGFTFANGYLQGVANSEAPLVPLLNKIIGLVIFFIGMLINIYSDRILQAAKEKSNKKSKEEGGKSKYVRIDDFLFKYIANPNYLGQIIEWLGYSLVCGHFVGYLFLFSTFNVLTPAAIVRSNWNKQNIESYPQERKAIFPLIL